PAGSKSAPSPRPGCGRQPHRPAARGTAVGLLPTPREGRRDPCLQSGLRLTAASSLSVAFALLWRVDRACERVRDTKVETCRNPAKRGKVRAYLCFRQPWSRSSNPATPQPGNRRPKTGRIRLEMFAAEIGLRLFSTFMPRAPCELAQACGRTRQQVEWKTPVCEHAIVDLRFHVVVDRKARD